MNTLACLVLAAAAAEAPAYHIDLAHWFADAATEQAQRTALLASVDAYARAQDAPTTPKALAKWLDDGQDLSRELQRHDAYVYVRGESDQADRADAAADETLGLASTRLEASMRTTLATMDGPRLQRWMAADAALLPWRYFVATGREQAAADARGASADATIATPVLDRLGESYQRLRRSLAPPPPASDAAAPDAAQAFAAQWRPYLEHEAGFAALLVPIVTVRDGLARLQGYAGAPEAAYARAGLSTAQVAGALAAVKASPAYRRVQADESREAARRLQVDVADLHAWDLEAGRRDAPAIEFTEAVKDVLGAVRSMGPVYTSGYMTLLEPGSGRVEWCRAPSCDDAGFSVGYSGMDSALFFGRFRGDIDSVRALAHEAAHAVHRQFMREHQPVAFYNEGPHFMFESFALFNEMLVLEHLGRTAATADERSRAQRALVDDAAFQVFGSALQAELEQSIYFGVRDGRVRSADDLDALTQTIRAAYLDAPRLAPEARAYWARERLYFTDPLYSVNYLFAGLLSLAYLRQFEHDPRGFALRYTALLKNGFDAPPRTLLGKFLHIDLDDVAGLVAGASQSIDDFASRLAPQPAH